LQDRINKLPPEIALEWCEKIEKAWEVKKLKDEFPEMLTVCDVGRDDARRRAESQEESGK
jgi:hypothetical protein